MSSGDLGAVFGRSWGVLGQSSAVLAHLAASWGQSWAVLKRLDALLSRLEAALERLRRGLGPF